MKKILVPIDFSDLTEKILLKTEEFAEAFNAQVLFIHVTEPVTELIKDQVNAQTIPSLGDFGGPYTTTIRYDVVREQAAHELKREHSMILEIKDRFTDKNIDAKALLVEGEIIDTIVNEAEQINADMVIMGSHGHGPWHKALLGSTTNKVLKYLKKTLIIVPADKNE
ncbi:MAG: universal stress protein [Victivallales bacterium]|nr:universal stress protein [Victivallales bacterium]